MKSSTMKYSNKMTSINTSMGNISIDNEAIAQYAGSVAMECFGVVGMAGINMRDGLVKLLKLDSMTRGINVMVHNNKLVINFHIIVAYGVSILAVSNNLISNVKYKVEEFTGIEIEKINIFVEGVKVID
ncbi:MAG: Asp23/Gls24 family envelope stress response protein [Lachnospiraceae bacterium]|jgi:uncharacterized alkaline shock family protein YloU|nr:Asp23/Gls24 family envelope stress response protein [Lachnospiraceae bacterium]